MKIALVHDYLSEAGGAERVLRVLADIYPNAPIHTAFIKNGTAKEMFKDKEVIESKWAPFLKIGRMYSYLRFLLPLIWKSIDLSQYDVVITSCSGYIARGFKVGKTTKVVAYCHTPPRWLYGYESPTGARSKWWGRAFMWIFGPFVRYFDFKSAGKVNVWIANSEEVARRIMKFYRKEATVVYPPVGISESANQRISRKDKYYLVVSRIVGGKGLEEVDQAATQGGFELKIVGEIVDPKLAKRLKHYVGRVSDKELQTLYENSKGFIAMARDEDFGMTLVEAMASGTPVLAYYGGGYKETVKEGVTGWFTKGTSPEEIAQGVAKMEKTKWEGEEIKKWAERFNRKQFEIKVRKAVGI